GRYTLRVNLPYSFIRTREVDIACHICRYTADKKARGGCERRNHSIRIHLADTRVEIVSNVKIAGAVQRDRCRKSKLRRDGWTAITAIALAPIASYRADGTIGAQFTYNAVGQISDIEIALTVARQS